MDSEAATHEEIWDDSALVDSWNEALEEYKVRQAGICHAAARFEAATDTPRQKYHSIHAKGGTVDDIVDRTPDGAAV